MTVDQVLANLKSGQVSAATQREWAAIEPSFDAAQTHETGIAGTLKLGKLGGHPVIVETAGPDLVAIRGFASRKAADQFVKMRLDQYDRLWDG